MDFNKEFSDFKNRESEQLAKFGEGARIYRILGEIEMKRGFAKYFYEAGQQSKRAEIDALKAELEKYQQEGYKLVPVDEIVEVKKSRFSFGEDEACELGNSMIENYSRNSKL